MLSARTYKFQIAPQTEHQHAHFRFSAPMSALPPKADIRQCKTNVAKGQ